MQMSPAQYAAIKDWSLAVLPVYLVRCAFHSFYQGCWLCNPFHCPVPASWTLPSAPLANFFILSFQTRFHAMPPFMCMMAIA